jgi:hypothetical protein
MREPTDDLISQLSSDAAPVTPNQPPLIRLLFVALPILAIMAVVAALAGDPHMVMDHMSDPAFALSTLSAVATGLTAIYAALAYAVPGRTNTGTTWVFTSALIWLISSGVLCTRGMAGHHGTDISIFASADCFFFIMLSGTVVALLFYAALRNAVFINTLQVTAMLGLAAATLGATLLAFFHPPETDLVDFGAHLAATAALILFMMTAGRGALARS